MYKCLTTVSVAFLTLAAVAAPDLSKLPPPSDKKDVSFAQDISPILKDSCYGCHGAERQRGALRLDTLEAALKGGKAGPVVVPGKSDKSPLVISVARIDPESAMPPMRRGGPRQGGQGGQNGNGQNGQGGQGGGPKPLTPEQVGLIRAWIDQGAK